MSQRQHGGPLRSLEGSCINKHRFFEICAPIEVLIHYGIYAEALFFFYFCLVNELGGGGGPKPNLHLTLLSSKAVITTTKTRLWLSRAITLILLANTYIFQWAMIK